MWNKSYQLVTSSMLFLSTVRRFTLAAGFNSVMCRAGLEGGSGNLRGHRAVPWMVELWGLKESGNMCLFLSA